LLVTTMLKNMSRVLPTYKTCVVTIICLWNA
jgi:hypothetical protein